MGFDYVEVEGFSLSRDMLDDDGFVIYSKFSWRAPIHKDEWWNLYKLYLRTDLWEEKRENCKRRYGGRCALCNAKATVVHHRDYPEILGQEDDGDLVALCHRCHHRYHHPFEHLDELRETLFSETLSGHHTICGLCKKSMNTNERSLTCDIVGPLWWIVEQYKKNGGTWVELTSKAGVPQWIIKSRDYGRLMMWELIERKRGTVGFYIPTALGIRYVEDFLNNVEDPLRLPHRVIESGSIPLKFLDDKMVSFQEALGKGFSKTELNRVDTDLLKAFEIKRMKEIYDRAQAKKAKKIKRRAFTGGVKKRVKRKAKIIRKAAI
jgi:uncharacterized CHY-type Zn-finger protein